MAADVLAVVIHDADAQIEMAGDFVAGVIFAHEFDDASPGWR